MPMNGVCDLELRQMIEGAFLPSRCEVSCSDGMSLTIHFPEEGVYRAMTRTAHLAELPDTRALLSLLGEIRHEREQLSRAAPLRSRG